MMVMMLMMYLHFTIIRSYAGVKWLVFLVPHLLLIWILGLEICVALLSKL